MDLSHWDLIGQFTIHEAACLAAGIDPKLSGLSSEQKAKVDTIKRVMTDAHDLAWKNLNYDLASKFDEDFPSFLDIDHNGELRSIEVEKRYQICLKLKKPMLGDFGDEDFTFDRKTLDLWFKEKGYQPAYCFVSQPKANEHEKQAEDRSISRAHVSDKLTRMNQAAEKFWAHADRNDRGTHPDNATVAAWLIQKGFSQTLAEKAATIIRPEWAPTGRKPEE